MYKLHGIVALVTPQARVTIDADIAQRRWFALYE